MLTIIILTASSVGLAVGIFGRQTLGYRDRDTRNARRVRDRGRRRSPAAGTVSPAGPIGVHGAQRELRDPWIVGFATQLHSTR